MSLRMCEPCEKLYLFEVESSAASLACPRCNAMLAPRTIRVMEDLPRFPIQLVRAIPTEASTSTPRG